MSHRPNTTYVFDVDGTLTPIGEGIPMDFFYWFLKWSKGKNYFLISGGDYDKIYKQLGEEIVHNAQATLANAGNAVYIQGKLIMHHEIRLPEDMTHYLEDVVKHSPYPKRHGNHLELRRGMVNFSICGRNASPAEREEFFLWDSLYSQRQGIVRHINTRWPEFNASIGGKISIDIVEQGRDKGQIINMIEMPAVFFGDHIIDEGNDYPLAQAILMAGGEVVPVETWKQTWAALKKFDQEQQNAH